MLLRQSRNSICGGGNLLNSTFQTAPCLFTLYEGVIWLGITKRALSGSLYREATRGFEPLMRVLQTLALPLGHVAEKIVF
jgi:hypothetical protein